MLGTAGYMSPEEVSELVAGARSNLFAWVVNEMVSGKRALPSIHGGALTEAEFAFFVLLHAPINQVLHVQLRDAH